MNRDAIKRALKDRFEQSLEQALDTVEQAPDGQWIAASEWQVRHLFQELMAESYQQLLQAKMEAAPQAAFSPSEPAPPQEQGKTAGHQRAHRRR